MARSGKINKVDTARSEPPGSVVSHAGAPLAIGEETPCWAPRGCRAGRRARASPGMAFPGKARRAAPIGSFTYNPRFRDKAFLLAKTSLC